MVLALASAIADTADPTALELAEWWDKVNAISASVGAIGTAGALIVAALAYRRQVIERRRDLAARVIFRISWDGVVLLHVTNSGELPIAGARFVERVDLQDSKRWGKWERGLLGAVDADRTCYTTIIRSDGDFTGSIGHIDAGRSLQAEYRGVRKISTYDLVDRIALYFIDSHGRRWVRKASGELFQAYRDRAPNVNVKNGRQARRLTFELKNGQYRAELYRRRAQGQFASDGFRIFPP